MQLPKHVRIVEVGPRDGLQNEITFVPTPIKIELIKHLITSGCQSIEVTSFVSPKRIPQLADNSEVLGALPPLPQVHYSVLVPNLQGFNAAIKAGAKEIAIFAATSETFSQHNIQCSIAQSIERYREVTAAAKQHHIKVRGYLSCCFGCPYEGNIDEQTVLALAQKLLQMGCYEICLGDTIGVATPMQVQHLIQTLTTVIPHQSIALHFHDTYGQAIANIFAALQCGITVFDSSVAGLGGCPYAPGAAGNVASEDVIYLLNGLGIKSGVDLTKLAAAGRYISTFLQKEPVSKVAKALTSKCYE